VIGKITVRMVSAFSSIKMGINMRVCGAKIIDMARELTGETKVAN